MDKWHYSGEDKYAILSYGRTVSNYQSKQVPLSALYNSPDVTSSSLNSLDRSLGCIEINYSSD